MTGRWSFWACTFSGFVCQRWPHNQQLSIGCLIDLIVWLIHSFNPFIPSFLHSFIHSLFQSLIDLPIISFIHSFIPSFFHSFIPSFIHSFFHSFIHSFIHSLFQSSVDLLVNSFIRFHLIWFDLIAGIHSPLHPTLLVKVAVYLWLAQGGGESYVETNSRKLWTCWNKLFVGPKRGVVNIN